VICIHFYPFPKRTSLPGNTVPCIHYATFSHFPSPCLHTGFLSFNPLTDVFLTSLRPILSITTNIIFSVVVRFKAVGNAPIMKQNFYKITASNRFQAVIQFLRKELGWKSSDPLFTYINLAFSPAPDDTVSNLFRSFATDNHLIVNYRCVMIFTM
jgi:hypothetical protein